MSEPISWVVYWGSIVLIAVGGRQAIAFHKRGMERVRNMR
jgi:hypothetical protein